MFPAVSQAKPYSVITENPSAGVREIFAGDEGFTFAAQYRLKNKQAGLTLSVISTNTVDIVSDYSSSPAVLRVNYRTKNGTLTSLYTKAKSSWKRTSIRFQPYQTHFAKSRVLRACDTAPTTAQAPQYIPEVASFLNQDLSSAVFDRSCKSDPEVFRNMSVGVNSLLFDTHESLMDVGNPKLLGCVISKDESANNLFALEFKAHRIRVQNDNPDIKIACQLSEPDKCASITETQPKETGGGKHVFQFNPLCFRESKIALSGFPDAASMAKHYYIHEFLHSPPLSLPEDIIGEMEATGCDPNSKTLFTTAFRIDRVVNEAVDNGELERFPKELSDYRQKIERIALKSAPEQNGYASRQRRSIASEPIQIPYPSFASIRSIVNNAVQDASVKLAPLVSLVESPAFAKSLAVTKNGSTPTKVSTIEYSRSPLSSTSGNLSHSHDGINQATIDTASVEVLLSREASAKPSVESHASGQSAREGDRGAQLSSAPQTVALPQNGRSQSKAGVQSTGNLSQRDLLISKLQFANANSIRRQITTSKEFRNKIQAEGIAIYFKDEFKFPSATQEVVFAEVNGRLVRRK